MGLWRDQPGLLRFLRAGITRGNSLRTDVFGHRNCRTGLALGVPGGSSSGQERFLIGLFNMRVQEVFAEHSDHYWLVPPIRFCRQGRPPRGVVFLAGLFCFLFLCLGSSHDLGQLRAEPFLSPEILPVQVPKLQSPPIETRGLALDGRGLGVYHGPFAPAPGAARTIRCLSTEPARVSRPV